MAENTQKRQIRYLNDSYAMETGALVALEDIKRRAKTPELEQIAGSLIGIVKTQIERLGARIVQLGGKVNAGKAALDGVLASGNSVTNAFHDQADKETQEVMKAYGLCHFEVAVYTSLREYSTAVGDHTTAQLAQTLINEEEDAARRLMTFLPQLARKPASITPRPSAGKSGGVGTPVVPAVLGTALIAGSTALAAWGISQMMSSKGGSRSTTTMPRPSTYVELEEIVIVTDPTTTVAAGMSPDVPTSGHVSSVYDAPTNGYLVTTPPVTTTATGDLL